MDQQQNSSDISSPANVASPRGSLPLIIGGLLLIILVSIGSYYFGVKSEQKNMTVYPTPLTSTPSPSIASHLIDFEKILPRSYSIRKYAPGEYTINSMDEWNTFFEDLSRGNPTRQDYNIAETLAKSTIIVIEETSRPLAGYTMAVSKVEDMGNYVEITINQQTECSQGAQSMMAGFPTEILKITKTSKPIKFVKKQIYIPCK